MRVPITVMGYSCDRCEHEWIPKNFDVEPTVCPSCKSPYWNKPRQRQPVANYDDFRKSIEQVLKKAAEPLTWTEIRTTAKLTQKFPNNLWVRRLEADIHLHRYKDSHGIIHWNMGTDPNAKDMDN